MGLDLTQVAPQIERLADKLVKGSEEKYHNLNLALQLMRNKGDDSAGIKERLLSSQTTWLAAEPAEKLTVRHAPLAHSPENIIFSTDGSHIDVDRHIPVNCYLINIGKVVLNYQRNSSAEIDSEAILYAEDPDLKIIDPANSNSYVEVSGAVLAVKRFMEELRYLNEIAERLDVQVPALGLLDGTLVLWQLAGKDTPGFIRDMFITRTLLPLLDNLQRISQQKKMAIASYISLPRSREVVNILRLLLCPHTPVNCDFNCRHLENKKIPCSSLNTVEDKEIFDAILQPWERSCLFLSRSSIMGNYNGHRIGFFYLKLEQEVVRIEIPAWVWDNNILLNLVHSLTVRQCVLGKGYPVALQEAHEKAVITGMDREAFRHLLETSLNSKQLPVNYSEKSRSKRIRWV